MEIRDVIAGITENLNNCHRISYVTGKCGLIVLDTDKNNFLEQLFLPICYQEHHTLEQI
jgi:hypothetical protein